NFSQLFIELRDNVLYEICGSCVDAVSVKFRNSLRFNLLEFLLAHANSAISRHAYSEAVANEFKLSPEQRMDTILEKTLHPRIYRMYFSATSHAAICHNPIKIVQNGSESLLGP
ncbi:MAG: hypothetical protein LBC42_00115, partial [Puniceicoccales bacterium]|nr:hypothetical protein [Puniceicoccales bacterium]